MGSTFDPKFSEHDAQNLDRIQRRAGYDTAEGFCKDACEDYERIATLLECGQELLVRDPATGEIKPYPHLAVTRRMKTLLRSASKKDF